MLYDMQQQLIAPFFENSCHVLSLDLLMFTFCAQATMQEQLRVQAIGLDSMKQVNSWQDFLCGRQRLRQSKTLLYVTKILTMIV